ncbi:type VI secretion system tube protein TssD [Flavobacterium sp. Leaf82]|uniref:type VI secretion system tube protein TssD n=2 Tax=unclassified Flavobacterium TaxID=196869 RepID=UPI0019D7010C|nr:type VI secretion system tube protein TssD [Flavobacterium sp. Leaf82]
MEKGEIHFYSKGERDMPTKKYKFNDAYIVYFSEIFNAESSENMQTILTISPAIQNYGTLKDFVTYWQVSQIKDSDPFYYRPQEEEDATVNINGHFYTKNGFYLGKIGSVDDVYITNELTFLELQKGKDVSKGQIIYFTEIYKFNNEQLLYRAHWVYGEGGGFFTDYYAHAIKNLRKHGVWGPANKPYPSDESMYKQKMTHKDKKTKKIINMYPGYFNGTDGNVNSKAFSKARKNLLEINSLIRANDAIKSIIGSIDETIKDPTDGCYQWVGGSGTEGLLSKNPDINNATGVINKTNRIDNVNFYHTFYKIKKE